MVPVKHVGVQVEAVGPNDGADFGIDAHLTKVGRIIQRLGHRSPKLVGEIDLADETICEGQPQPESIKWLYGGDASEHVNVIHGNGSMLASGVRA